MMKKNILLVGLILFFSVNVTAQKFYTKTGRISFYSSAPMENIEAVNRSVVVLMDSQTGDIQFSVLMKSFDFKKALMQEHFNKNYVESDKFPKSQFKGSITNNSSVQYSTDGTYTANVKGDLTIHGVTKPIETTGTITVKDGKPVLHAVFPVQVSDYQITIPKIYRDNIAKTVKVTVDCALTTL